MIEKIRMVGCQSWNDTEIDLINGLNVIAAPNNTGKSVLFKMFKIAVSPKYFSPAKRKKLIRWGSSKALMGVSFTDGCEGVVILTQTNVTYAWKSATDENYSYSTEPRKEFIDELGFLVSNDGKFVANIIDADQDLMLVDNNSKGTYEFIDMLCNDNELEILKENTKQSRDALDPVYQRVCCDVMKTTNELNKMSCYDITGEENSLNELELLVKFLRGLSTVDISKIQIIDKSFENLEHIMKFLEVPELPKLLEEYNCSYEQLLHFLEFPRFPNIMSYDERLDVLAKFLEFPDFPEILTEVDYSSLVKFLEIPNIPMIVSDAEVKQCEEEMKKCGRLINCEHCGEVIFDGQKCVPVNN